jgi:hypothetical protein
MAGLHAISTGHIMRPRRRTHILHRSRVAFGDQPAYAAACRQNLTAGQHAPSRPGLQYGNADAIDVDLKCNREHRAGSGSKIRPASRADLDAGLPYLRQLLQLLPALRVVIMGRKPISAEPDIRMARPEIGIFRSPHPSPPYVNNRHGNRGNILAVLHRVAQQLSSG